MQDKIRLHTGNVLNVVRARCIESASSYPCRQSLFALSRKCLSWQGKGCLQTRLLSTQFLYDFQLAINVCVCICVCMYACVRVYVICVCVCVCNICNLNINNAEKVKSRGTETTKQYQQSKGDESNISSAAVVHGVTIITPSLLRCSCVALFWLCLCSGI